MARSRRYTAELLSVPLLPQLVLASGFCGIAYEVIYPRILGQLLGNQFSINAATLLTFILGVGLGSRYAHKLMRHLWAIEGLIGAYGVLLVFYLDDLEALFYEVYPALGRSEGFLLFCGFVLVLSPAILIGFSVPMFSAYLASLGTKRAFSWTYALYNLGAAITAIALEFYLFRALGARTTVLLLAIVNVAIAVAVFVLARKYAVIAAIRSRSPAEFPTRILVGLTVVSVASAIFQLTSIKLAEAVLGPYHETFALVVATALFGIAAGSALVGRFRLTFDAAAGIIAIGILWTLLGFALVGRGYAAAYPIAVTSHPLLVVLKFLFVFAFAGIPAFGFGATVPAILRAQGGLARKSGTLLFWSSLGNVAGFLLMIAVIHHIMTYGIILVTVLVITLIGAAIPKPTRRNLAAAGVAALAGAVALGFGWNEAQLYLGYDAYHSSSALTDARQARSDFKSFRSPGNVFAIVERHGQPFFYINGYLSFPLSRPTEKVVGALSAMFAPNTDRAAVLGLGSGASASAIGLVFDHTDAVEINPAIVANLDRLRPYNIRLLENPDIEIHLDDGAHFLKATEERYSLILNTVTSPRYFSSSNLYTLEFLELVRSRLTPAGVYVTWLDARMGDEGVDITFETLRAAFGYCALSYLDADYYLMACSNEPLRLRSYREVASNTTLTSHMQRRHNLAVRTFPYALLAPDALELTRTEAPINTRDRPVLEFAMTQLEENYELPALLRTLEENVDLRKLRPAVEDAFPWNSGDFILHSSRAPDLQPVILRLAERADLGWRSEIGPAVEARCRELTGKNRQRLCRTLRAKVEKLKETTPRAR